MVFFAGVQDSREDETTISPSEDEDGDDDENYLDEERKSDTGVKIFTMKSCFER